MSDLFREVDEAMRTEKWTRFWNENKTAIVVGVTALILGTAFFSFWNHYTTKKNTEATTMVMKAQEAPKPAEALQDVAPKTPSNMEAMALIKSGAAVSNTKTVEERRKAAAVYKKASEIKTANKDVTEIATLQYVGFSIDDKDVQSKELIEKLKPLAENKKSPWRYEALFLSAFVKAEKDQDYKTASNELKSLAEMEGVSADIKQRSISLAALYEQKQGQKK